MKSGIFEQSPKLHSVENVRVIGTGFVTQSRVFVVNLPQGSHVMHYYALHLFNFIWHGDGGWYFVFERGEIHLETRTHRIHAVVAPSVFSRRIGFSPERNPTASGWREKQQREREETKNVQ